VQSQLNGDIVFADILLPPDKRSTEVMTPITYASSIKLGQTIFALSGRDSNSISQGIIEKVEGSLGTTTAVTAIRTTVAPGNVLLGSPLFTITGDIVGIKTSSLTSQEGTAFYPMSLLSAAIPTISR
jgi:S1-C subfamily serine protease